MSILEIGSDAYHDDMIGGEPTLSKSIAHVLLSRSPKHAWTAHPKLNPAFQREQESKFDLGTAAHALFLEGDGSVEVFAFDNWTTKDAKACRAEARQHGKTPMLGKDWDRVEEMVDALRTQLAALTIDPPLFQAGKPEQTITWTENGVACKARLDYLHDNHQTIDDLKTSHNANPENWTRRTLYDIGADFQGAWYRRAVKAATGIEPDFRFVVVETKPPFELCVVSLAPAALALAEAKVDHALEIWKRCLDSGVWKGYPKDVCYASPPAWMEAQFLEKEEREAA